MPDGYLLDAASIAALQRHVERLQNQVYDLSQRMAAVGRSERPSVLVAKVGASIIAAQTSGTAQFASVTVQTLNPKTGAMVPKSPAYVVTAWNLYDQQIPAGAYVLIAREFENGGWVILSRVLTFWRFTLNEAFAGGDAAGDILEPDGTDTGADADIEDPLAVFSSTLGNGDAGWCFRQGGVYYAIQAPCPT